MKCCAVATASADPVIVTTRSPATASLFCDTWIWAPERAISSLITAPPLPIKPDTILSGRRIVSLAVGTPPTPAATACPAAPKARKYSWYFVWETSGETLSSSSPINCLYPIGPLAGPGTRCRPIP